MIADLEMQRALDHYHRVGLAGLSEQDKTLAALWSFESGVENNGFAHFYASADGELAGYAPAAFRNVGAEPLARLAELALTVFGATGVPPVKADRVRAVAALSAEQRAALEAIDNEYDSSELDLDGLIDAYLARNP